MRIEYDPEADALYIALREAAVARTVEVTEGLVVDVDGEGRPVGIEVLDARELLGAAGLGKVTLENLLAGVARPDQG